MASLISSTQYENCAPPIIRPSTFKHRGNFLGNFPTVDCSLSPIWKPHLGAQLDEYVKQFNGLVKIVRNKRREGLIRARSIGAQNAVMEVLVFLDAHCEAEPNWLPPLLAPIARNDRISTVPMIDGIDGNHYTFSSQGQ